MGIWLLKPETLYYKPGWLYSKRPATSPVGAELRANIGISTQGGRTPGNCRRIWLVD